MPHTALLHAIINLQHHRDQSAQITLKAVLRDLWPQAEAAHLRTQVEGLAKQLAAAEASQEGAKAAAAASQELRKCQGALVELQAEYNRVSNGWA